jgi:excisionase family DNA binding protein
VSTGVATSTNVPADDLATMPPLLLTTTAAGEVLGVSKATVARMIVRGILPHLRFGGLVRVPVDELHRWMALVRGD